MIRMILTDIEGTISSISFVKDVLFPYARKKIPAYLMTRFDQPEIRNIYKQTCEEAGKTLDIDGFVNTMIQWIDEDKKVTPLKSLQGLVWEEGFRNGEYKAHFYMDALEKLRFWKNRGHEVFVYSSGSVFAQKLFFSYTEAGNVLDLFSGHFDTTTGGKKESESYRKISDLTHYEPGAILFLSDIREELDAAKSAGLKTALVSREGLTKQPGHREYTDFSKIELKDFE